MMPARAPPLSGAGPAPLSMPSVRRGVLGTPTGAFVPPTTLDTSDLGAVRASGSTRNEFLGAPGGGRECVGALPPAATPHLVIGGLPPVGLGLRSGTVVPDSAPGGLGLNPVGADMSAVELGSRAGAVVPALPTGGMGLTPASTAVSTPRLEVVGSVAVAGVDLSPGELGSRPSTVLPDLDPGGLGLNPVGAGGGGPVLTSRQRRRRADALRQRVRKGSAPVGVSPRSNS